MNDFLDNLGAEQYQKMHVGNARRPGNPDEKERVEKFVKEVTEFDKITPETYEEMNREFVEEGTMVRIEVPTQEAIDKWKTWIVPDMHERTTPTPDMVQDMWDAIGGRPGDA